MPSWTSSHLRLDRVWTKELEVVRQLAKVELHLPEPGSGFACVLGSGRRGRVFRALDEEGRSVALKLALDPAGRDAINSEKNAYDGYANELRSAQATTTMIRSVVNSTRSAGLVISPIGVPLPLTLVAITSALHGLIKLSKNGLCHGDARPANVVWIESEKRALWTDLHSLDLVRAGDEEEDFLKDVEKFLLSLPGVTVDAEDLRTAAAVVLRVQDPEPDLSPFESILKVFDKKSTSSMRR